MTPNDEGPIQPITNAGEDPQNGGEPNNNGGWGRVPIPAAKPWYKRGPALLIAFAVVAALIIIIGELLPA